MSEPFTLIEVGWEVCNKVGGVHTVLSTKAKILSSRFDDHYVAIGPWLLGGEEREPVFEDEPGFEGFAESCRALGVPVRVGRWRIPGRPRAILVAFSGLFETRDGILAGLWERFRVDSLTGGWSYVEPVCFGWAAGIVLERYWEEFLAEERRPLVVQLHEWTAGACLLYVKEKLPVASTIFTTHATVLGRAIAATGRSPADALDGARPEEVAARHGVIARHSLEGVCARVADVFTTVSDLSAAEAERFHGRAPAPILPNGLDLDVMDELAAGTTRSDARARLEQLARRFLGEDVAGAAFVCLSGRYEFHNKGIDLLLDALALLAQHPGRRLVAFLLVPAGNSGLSRDVAERLAREPGERTGTPGIATHNLIDAEGDPIRRRCAALGLANARGGRVLVIHIPVYLARGDGLLDLSYEGMLRGVDLSCFPSFYEPWGHTPQESLAMGVPTVTTDRAGFGLWARERGFGAADGVHLLERDGVEDATAARALAKLLDRVLAGELDGAELAAVCRRTGQQTSWLDLVRHYDEAFAHALAIGRERFERGVPPPLRVRRAAALAPASSSARPRLVAFEVAASLPPALAGLERLAANWWWSWTPDAEALFEELSPRMWEASGRNPVVLLRRAFREDLDERAAEPAYLDRLASVLGRFAAYMAEPAREPALPAAADPIGRSAAAAPSAAGAGDGPLRRPIAYFCAEFGIHEALAIYGGGLGVLAGDHLKSASDLLLPLVGIGLFYRKGYVRQRIGPGGEQVSIESNNDPRDLALELVRDPLRPGRPLSFSLPLPGAQLQLRVWRASIGRVSLYLLDSDLPENRPEERDITQKLYAGDQETRVRQEIVLGKGGARLLAELGIEPAVFHLNEGHAAFATLERVSQLEQRQGLTFDEAREVVRASTVFTTHTPVQAGHDRFAEDLMRRYFADAEQWVGLSWQRFFALGQADGEAGPFNMTYLALGFAGFVNGVSALHADVSRELLRPFFAKLLEIETPIQGITNGVHLRTWTHAGMARLLGVNGRGVRGADFARADELDRGALWELRCGARARLLAEVRARVVRSFVERGESPRVLARVLEGLEGQPLLIGYARRFAPYKRAYLLFKDIERLAALCGDPERPVRVLIAGKAHPRDPNGLEIVREVVGRTRIPELVGRVYFLEDYSMGLARELVQGVDVWLNTPIRRLEASGTSGMKVAANGGLNLSILDGWWPEAQNGTNGWTIGEGDLFSLQDHQDEFDAATLYRLLEEEVVAAFYERDEEGVPRRFVERIRRSLATIPPHFDTDRMVSEYLERAYAPLASAHGALAVEHYAAARALAREHHRLRRGFEGVRIRGVEVGRLEGLRVGDAVEVAAEVELGALAPADVVVEFVHGHRVDSSRLHGCRVVVLRAGGARARSTWSGLVRLERSGSFAWGIRVRAAERGAVGGALADLVVWAGTEVAAGEPGRSGA